MGLTCLITNLVYHNSYHKINIHMSIFVLGSDLGMFFCRTPPKKNSSVIPYHLI